MRARLTYTRVAHRLKIRRSMVDGAAKDERPNRKMDENPEKHPEDCFSSRPLHVELGVGNKKVLRDVRPSGRMKSTLTW